MGTMVYKNAAGKRVSSVTTILKNIGWSGRPLMIWANRLGLEGIDLDSPEARKAADIGTIGHSFGQAWLEAGCPSLDGYPAIRASVVPEGTPWTDLHDQGWKAFLSLPRWWFQQKLSVVATELALVSEQHQYGGTMDLVGRDEEGAIHVIDFKTGKDVYAEHQIQIAAYGRLFAEARGEEPRHYSLLRWGRDGDFHHHSWQDMTHPWRAFLLARELHDLHKKLD